MTEADVSVLGRGVKRVEAKSRTMMQDAPVSPKPSKYRNVKTVADGQRFDSQREADYWLSLRVRERAGEISDLSRQYVLDLRCPDPAHPECSLVVARYIADYRYLGSDGLWHYVDAKGKRTQMYLLKRKWIALQDNIEIEEV